MIKSIKFKEDYICFFKKQSFEFKDITLLVGDQGCGKSTMLSLIHSICGKNEETETVDFILDKSHEAIYLLNMEKDNPATSQGNPYGPSREFLSSLMSRFKSHGENLVPMLNSLEELKKSIILIDEPETALSLRSQYNFIETMKKLAKQGNQIIIATHCLTFMEAFSDNILSLEHLKYVKLKSFIKSQKNASDFKDKREDKIIKKTKCKMGINCKCANETGWYNNQCEHYVKEGRYSR